MADSITATSLSTSTMASSSKAMSRKRKQRGARLSSSDESSGSLSDNARMMQPLEISSSEAPSSSVTAPSSVVTEDVVSERRKEPRQRNQYKYWCWTLFNYEHLPEDKLPRLEQWDAITYLVWQRECAPTTGKMHLQGYVELETPREYTSVLKWLPPGAHIESRKGTAEQAASYCKKPDNNARSFGEPYESGTISVPEQGKRNDLEAFQEDAKEGMTYEEALWKHGNVLARFPQYATEILDAVHDANVPKLLEFTPRYSWQQDILDYIATEPDRRVIYWVYDQYGNSGKSYLAEHLQDAHGAFLATEGRSQDIAYAYKYERIVIFDFARSQADAIPFGIMEQLKNGRMSSTKYRVKMKKFERPHIIVFANFECAENRFSSDRIKLIELGEDHEKVTRPLVDFFR